MLPRKHSSRLTKETYLKRPFKLKVAKLKPKVWVFAPPPTTDRRSKPQKKVRMRRGRKLKVRNPRKRGGVSKARNKLYLSDTHGESWRYTAAGRFQGWDVTYTNGVGTAAKQLTIYNPGTSVSGINRAFPNAYSFSKEDYVNQEGRLMAGDLSVAYNVSQGANVLSTEAPLTPLFGADVNIAYNNAVSSLYDSLRGDLDLSIDFAESHQVVRMLKEISKLTGYVKSFDPRSIKNVGRKWLEYQYGIRPLVRSVYGTFAEVMKPTLAGFQNYDAKGKHVVTKVVNTGVGIGVQDSTDSVRVNISASYNISGDQIDQLSRYTSLNPVSISWERLPYSFVVDWVYNIGGYLRSLESAVISRQNFVFGCQTVTRLSQVKTQNGYSTFGGSSVTIGVGGRDHTKKSFARTVLSGTPFPRKPVFNVSMGAQRCFSAASLLSLHLGKR